MNHNGGKKFSEFFNPGDVVYPVTSTDRNEVLKELLCRLAYNRGIGNVDRAFQALIQRLKTVAKKYRVNIAGEGGEYESLTLNAPFFGEPVTYETSEIRTTAGRSELVLGGFA